MTLLPLADAAIAQSGAPPTAPTVTRSAAGAPTAGTLSVAQAREVVDRTIALISKQYVVPQRRPAIVAKLEAGKAAGRYDVDSAAELAARLGPDLVEAGHDKHLWIVHNPAQAAALAHGEESQGAHDYAARDGKLHNEGYETLRLLPGNVRYVELTGFRWNGAATTRAVANAMRFLAGGDAVIIDLRRNGGGSAEAVQALVSYFMPANPRVLMTFHEGGSGKSHSTRVLERLPAARLVGKPLYVLTSADTASAAEEFADHVRLFKLGTLVGTATAGAANNNTLFPAGHGFVLSVSTGRPEHPVDHGNWEGVGVAPHVAVSAAAALDEAQLLALEKLDARPGADHATYAWAIDGLRGHMRPPALDAATLAEYAGTFGVRTITLANGTLTFQRESRAPTTLTALAADLFAFGNTEDIRLRFRRDGGHVTGFDLITVDGQTVKVDRSS
jgi:hypothetical protein